MTLRLMWRPIWLHCVVFPEPPTGSPASRCRMGGAPNAPPRPPTKRKPGESPTSLTLPPRRPRRETHGSSGPEGDRGHLLPFEQRAVAQFIQQGLLFVVTHTEGVGGERKDASALHDRGGTSVEVSWRTSRPGHRTSHQQGDHGVPRSSSRSVDHGHGAHQLEDSAGGVGAGEARWLD